MPENVVKEKDTEEVRYVHMRLGGNFGDLITDLAREKAWQKNKRGDAIIMLMDGLHGITIEQAKQIIDGEYKLVTSTDSTVEMVEDGWTPPDFKAIIQQVRDITSSILHPHSTVTGWHWSERIPQSKLALLRSDCQMARNLLEDNPLKAQRMAELSEKIWTEWMEHISEKHGLGENDGRRRNLQPVMGEFFDDMKKDAIERIATADLPEKLKGNLIRVADGQIDAIAGKVEVFVDKDFKYDTGWVDREGVYFGCKPGQHVTLATMIVQEVLKTNVANGERHLEELGWLKCTHGRWLIDELAPNKAQLDTVAKWAKKWGEPFNWDFSMMTMRELRAQYGGGE